jgi:hypothetical protein
VVVLGGDYQTKGGEEISLEYRVQRSKLNTQCPVINSEGDRRLMKEIEDRRSNSTPIISAQIEYAQ